MAEKQRTEVAGPDQRAAKQMRPGHCTNLWSQIECTCSNGNVPIIYALSVFPIYNAICRIPIYVHRIKFLFAAPKI